MRVGFTALLLLAAAAVSAPAIADDVRVYVRIGYTENLMILVEVPDSVPQSRRTARATQFAYYSTPAFSFEGTPIRLTETEFEIDCVNRASRRVRATAYRDIGDRVGDESYSEAWTPIAPDHAMDATRRLACEGLRPGDAFYTSLDSAVVIYGKLLREDAAG